MNFKKILAGVAAGAMVFASLAMPTFADDVYSTTGPEAGGGGETYSLAGLEIDYTAIDEIVIEISVDSGYVNGCVGYNSVSINNWVSVGYEISSTTGTIDVNSLAGDIADTDSLQLQFWWINPIYDEDGNITGAGTVTVNSITIYDASGEVLYQDPAAEVVEETEPEVVETVVGPLGVSYNTSAKISSSDYTGVDYTSAVLHIEPLYNDASWNDWCQIYVAVTVDGNTTYYTVAGASATWDTTVDDNGTDDTDDDIKVLTTDENFLYMDTTNGTDITVDLTGDEWTIEVVACGWESAPDSAYAQVTATLTGVTVVDEETGTETGSESGTESTEDSGATTTVATSSNNDASEDGDSTSAAYLLVLVALAGVAFAGVKKFQA